MKKLSALLVFILISGLLISVPRAQAERLWTSGFEMGTSTAGTEFGSNGLFSAAIDGVTTTAPRSGKWEMCLNETNNFNWFADNYKGVTNNNTSTLRAYVNFSGFPAAGTSSEVMGFAFSTSNSEGSLRVNPSGQLFMVDSTFGQLGASSTAMATGTWQLIELQSLSLIHI